MILLLMILTTILPLILRRMIDNDFAADADADDYDDDNDDV